MLKRRRTIVLYEKVGAPRQRVRNNERHGSEPPAAFDHRSAQQHPAQNRANAVDHSRACLTVRSHVRRPEFGKRHGRPLALLLLRGAYHKPVLTIVKIKSHARRDLGTERSSPALLERSEPASSRKTWSAEPPRRIQKQKGRFGRPKRPFVTPRFQALVILRLEEQFQPENHRPRIAREHLAWIIEGCVVGQ